MSWDVWDPFEDMKKFHKEMEDSMRNMYKTPIRAKNMQIRQPLADIIETKDSVIAKIELPGVDKKDIELNITENMLSVKAEKKHESEEKNKNFYRCERSYASFQRAFSLPARVIAEKADAEMKNGILTVKIPKKAPRIEEKPKAKRIAVK